MNFDVKRELSGTSARRPVLRIEMASTRHFVWSQHQQVTMAFRVEPRYSGVTFARCVHAGSPQAIAPIPATVARRMAFDGWTRYFHHELEQTGTLLYPGCWRLEPPSSSESSFGGLPLVRRLANCLQRASGHSTWNLQGSGDVFALRASSPEDAGRVKAYIKLAKQNMLPPILLFFVSGLDSWLLMDGHDRLLAALIAGVAPTILCLTSLTTHRWTVDMDSQTRIEQSLTRQLTYPLTHKQLDGVNRRLIALYAEPMQVVPRTRGWWMVGGQQRWEREAERLGMLAEARLCM